MSYVYSGSSTPRPKNSNAGSEPAARQIGSGSYIMPIQEYNKK